MPSDIAKQLGELKQLAIKGFSAVADDFSDVRRELADFKTQTHENFTEVRQRLAEVERTLMQVSNQSALQRRSMNCGTS